MTLQHSGGFPVGYAKGAYPQSGYKVLGLMFGEVFGGWELWEGFLFLLFLVLLDVGKIGVLFFLGLVGFGVVFG